MVSCQLIAKLWRNLWGTMVAYSYSKDCNIAEITTIKNEKEISSKILKEAKIKKDKIQKENGALTEHMKELTKVLQNYGNLKGKLDTDRYLVKDYINLRKTLTSILNAKTDYDLERIANALASYWDQTPSKNKV